MIERDNKMRRKYNKKISYRILRDLKKRYYYVTSICIVVSLILIFTFICDDNYGDKTYLRGYLLDGKQMAEKGYTGLTRDYSENSVVIYDNKNGKKTIHIYSGPIEFTRNSISIDKEGYLAEGNYVTTYFPSVFSSSLYNNEETGAFEKISYIDIKANGRQDNYINIFQTNTKENFKGECIENVNIFGQNSMAIQYKNIFGQKSDLYFYPTIYGVNSEIVIPQKGSTELYTFRIKVPEMLPDSKTPDYISIQKKDFEDEILSIISAPLLVDNSGKWSFKGQAKFIEKDYSDGTYIVQFIPDMDFLNDSNTKYPVVMNQSFYLAHNNENADTTVYSGDNEKNVRHYLSPYLIIGDNTFKGEGRSLIRFESLNNININSEDIVSAKYCFRNLFDLPKKAKVELYAVISDWCSVNTMWNTMPEYDSEKISSVSVLKKGDYSLDITDLLKKMIKSKGDEDSIYNIRNSFFIKNGTPNSEMILASGDNGIFMPCLEIVINM